MVGLVGTNMAAHNRNPNSRKVNVGEHFLRLDGLSVQIDHLLVALPTYILCFINSIKCIIDNQSIHFLYKNRHTIKNQTYYNNPFLFLEKQKGFFFSFLILGLCNLFFPQVFLTFCSSSQYIIFDMLKINAYGIKRYL